MTKIMSPEELEQELRAIGAERYHDKHPFHKLLHGGKLNKGQVQAWALNRYYYQSTIPLKDAVVIPDGYRQEVVIRWGDPILPGAPEFDFANQTPDPLLQPLNRYRLVEIIRGALLHRFDGRLGGVVRRHHNHLNRRVKRDYALEHLHAVPFRTIIHACRNPCESVSQ